jgi:ArsR family transcriptional regulator, arsenate/arsenite/antimonite-responsive transcriptional repressor / arsenate reductase (thioredoxin)
MDTERMTIEDRAGVHAALGDPTRLTIVDILSLGDASPGELAQQLGLPTNLVAHHVNVLHDTGIVVRSPSEGDRRRTYIRLIPERLAALVPPEIRPVHRVVFVCTHNSARSQLATALWAERSAVSTTSAGTQPADRVHPRAVRVARRHGLKLDAATTAHVADVVQAHDFIVAVCDNAHEHLPAGVRPDLHWSVRDPAPANTDAAFESAYADIAARIDRLAPFLTTGGAS